MFIKNLLKTKNTQEKIFTFDVFKSLQNTKDDPSLVKEGVATKSYNFISSNGSLKSGYGFSELVMPENDVDLDTEQQFPVAADEVQKIWQLKWYDSANDRNCYCLFYYNEENKVCFDDLFAVRLSVPYSWPTEFTSLPFITNYRLNKQDSILLSGKDENFMVICGTGQSQSGQAPAIVSCCTHYGKLFAITAKARGTLVYTDTDIINWTDENAKNLDFSDGRGDLNKILSFNDYIYLFRDFGITKVSVYSGEEEFAVSHVYKSSGYIYPETITERGDEVYFLEGDRLKSFDGLNVKEIELDCLSLIKGQDNRYANAAVFDGKYFLACRGSITDQNIGCEAYEDGYKNNLLIAYDFVEKTVDILRGVDIRQMIALENHLKTKLIACFYNENKNKIGQLTKNGKIFGTKVPCLWKSGKMDFGEAGKRKMVKEILITSYGDCAVAIKSEEGEKTFYIQGNINKQKIPTKIFGETFEIAIHSQGEDEQYITDFSLVVSK